MHRRPFFSWHTGAARPASLQRGPTPGPAAIPVVLGFVLVIAVTSARGGQETRTLILRALDEPTRIQLDNIKLGDAIGRIATQTGVPIVMPPAAMKLVPQGAETIVRQVDIANMPLRVALEELLTPLGMSFVVQDGHVEVVPKDVVRRLARAPTWDELETLRWLSTSHPGSDPSVLESLRPRVQFRVGVPGAWTPLSKAIADVGAGAGDEVLTVACRNLGWSWSLAGKHIVIAPAQERIREQLRAVLSIRLNNRPLIDILQAVGKRVGVRIAAEPGAVSTLPDDVRGNVSVNAQNQPAEQVLDAIAANTGLGYIVVPDGVIFYRPGNIDLDPRAGPGAGPGGEPTPGGARPAGDPYVAKVTIPLDDGTSIEWLIRRSELPEDLRARRRRDLDRLFDAVRRHAADNPP